MNINDLYEQRRNYFLAPSQTVRGAVIFLLLAGVVTFAAGMVMGDHTRVWGSFLFNVWFFFSLALGGIAFAGMQDVIGAKWGRPIIRLHESFASFLPVAAGLFILFFICIKFDVAGADGVYKWIKDPSILEHFKGKNSWLVETPMLIRNAVSVVLITLLASWQLRLKLSRDKALMDGDKARAHELGLSAQRRLRYWSAPILICYAILFSFMSFDLLKSLSPLWFSTLWGGWAFAIMMQTLMATLLVFMFALRNTAIGQMIQREQFHDVGKLMHGFTIFFAYLTYAHILTYWYGNIPEETEYFIHRMHAPWIWIVIAAPVMSFLIPLFALIPKTSKWTSVVTLPIAAMILFAQWLAFLLVVMPEVVADASKWTLPWIEVGVFFGILGLFILAVASFGKRHPMIAVADPLLPGAYEGHH
jgi:hypothetical protein